MSDRTFGATRDCAGCRYWSKMLARASSPSLVVTAMCLADGGPHAGQYVAGYVKCDHWRSGELGAIDDPNAPDYEDEKT